MNAVLSPVKGSGSGSDFNSGPALNPVKVAPYRFTDPLSYATDPDKAKAYVASRRQDALAMTAGGILVLPYAKIRHASAGALFVNEVWCANADCAVAFILARWW